MKVETYEVEEKFEPFNITQFTANETAYARTWAQQLADFLGIPMHGLDLDLKATTDYLTQYTTTRQTR